MFVSFYKKKHKKQFKHLWFYPTVSCRPSATAVAVHGTHSLAACMTLYILRGERTT